MAEAAVAEWRGLLLDASEAPGSALHGLEPRFGPIAVASAAGRRYGSVVGDAVVGATTAVGGSVAAGGGLAGAVGAGGVPVGGFT